jgi:molecular chaperone DnaK
MYVPAAIDHGVNHSAIAIMESDGPRVIKPDGIEPRMPSAVYINKHGRMLVGRPAYEAMLIEKQGEGTGHTRYMIRIGEDYRYTFDEAKIVKTAPELGGIVMRELLKAAYEETGQEIKACVITIPAKFEQSACEGTRKAASEAGLLYSPLLQEPIAAAFAYDFIAKAERSQWIIFDLGSGTLDVSLVVKRNGQMIVPEDGHAGDNRLGSGKFDRELMDYVLAELKKKYSLNGFSENNPEYRSAWGKLMLAIEAAKITLSSKKEAIVELDGTLCKDSRGAPVRVAVPITRILYEKIIAPDVGRAVHICQTLINSNRLTPKDIDGLILLGSTTRTPYIQNVLSDRLNIPLLKDIDPMTAVVQGAAIYASTVEIPEEIRIMISLLDAPSSKVNVKLEYECKSNLLNCNIVGKIEWVDQNESECIVEIERKDGGWSSGQIPVDDNGIFTAELMLIDQKEPHLSKFKTTVFNKEWKPLKTVDEPEIWYPLPEGPGKVAHSIRIPVKGNQTAVLIKKGADLPARGRGISFTTKALRKGNKEDNLCIPVLESVTHLLGAEDEHADCNVHVGSIVIKGNNERVTRDLPSGSEIDLTIEMNEAREISLIAYIPFLDEEFEATFVPEPYGITGEDIEKRFKKEKSRLEKIKKLHAESPVKIAAQSLDVIEKMEAVKTIEKELALVHEGEKEACYRAWTRVLELSGAINKIQEDQFRAQVCLCMRLKQIKEEASEGILSFDDLTRILAAPLGCKLLGTEMMADVYSKNGFRFLAIPASADYVLLNTESQKFRNSHKLDPQIALNSSIQICYRMFVSLENVLDYISKLHDPRHRIICELFWYHVSKDLFDLIKKERCIASSRIEKVLTEALNKSNEYDSTIIKHALAITYHNLAISNELVFAAGKAEWSSNYWQNALSCWAEVLNADLFWKYLASRVEKYDDPRLKPDDVEELRAQLPGIILGLNALFALEYAKAQQNHASSQHIALIKNSNLPEHAKKEVLGLLVQSLTSARLDPLIHQVNSELLGNSGKQHRKSVEKVIHPVLEEAMAVRNDLLKELKLSPELAELSGFDRLCESVVKILETKINYDSDDRIRSILYSILTVKKMLSLPLSSALKRKLEQLNRNDVDILYGEFQSKKGSHKVIDPSKCWFLDGEESSPDASIQLPIYKVTSVKGVSVRWEKRQILVPRSELALKVHRRELTLPQLANLRQDDKSKKIKAEIEEVKAKRDEAAKQSKENCDHSILRQKELFEDRLNAFNNQITPEEIKLKEHVAKIEAKLNNDITAEQRRCSDVCDQTKKQKAGPINKAREEYNKIVKEYKGFRSGTRLELPLVGIASSVLAVIALIITLTNNISSPRKPFLLPIVGLVIGSIIGLCIGRARRLFKIKQSAAPLKKLTRILDDELVRMQKQSQNTINGLKKQAEIDASQSKERLLVINGERETIEGDYNTQVEQLRHEAESKISSIQTAATKKIKRLEEELEARIKPKPESDEKSFPPYQVAKSRNYEDGAGPSENEINRLVQREFENFKYSLTYEEQRTIAFIFQTLGEKKATEIINMLMILSPSERRKKLSELNILSLLRRWY